MTALAAHRGGQRTPFPEFPAALVADIRAARALVQLNTTSEQKEEVVEICLTLASAVAKILQAQRPGFWVVWRGREEVLEHGCLDERRKGDVAADSEVMYTPWGSLSGDPLFLTRLCILDEGDVELDFSPTGIRTL
ncbi:MAG TPA: hypothetical protein VMR98_05365, partial [Candidatus Polarisedimenticolaceae bacterium]|nr:hypothetical protein [Candidatus Polarisedimenticolaceae bacterium]